MKTSRATKLVLPVLLATAALIAQGSNAARAQSPATYVSSTGLDTNNCQTPATACASFAVAQNNMVDGGMISCINPGLYGSFTITKSITIDCQAGGGGSNSQFLIINAPGKNVKLRNISVNAVTNGGTLIDIISAGSVHLENVFVSGATAIGIYDHRTGPGKLFISDSSIVANTGAAIVVAPAGGTVIGAVLDNVRVRDSNFGIAVGSGGRVMIKRSVFSGNVTAGVESDPGGIIGINETLISFNGTGILASGGSTVSISNSDIDSNSTAISGTTRCYGNNRIFANSSDGTPPTPVGSPSNENGLR